MKTCIILTPGFPKDENDTTCLPAFQQFVLSLQKNYSHIEFIIITFQYPFEKKEYKWYGSSVIPLGGSNKPGVRRLIIWIKAYKTLQKLRTEKKLIGIYSLWLTECALVGKLFSRIYHLKHYMWLIGQDAKISNQYIKRIKPKAKEVIAMSDFLAEEMHKNHSILPFMVAENGINESAFPKFNDGERTIDVLGVGSLIPLKNYSLFIDIIYGLSKSFPDINAVIAGVGEEASNLNKKVRELGLENNVTFMGLVTHTGIFELMNNSKIFLHTSTYEGNSTVLMEALYSGCYTFSTQALSTKETTHLRILNKKEDFIESIKRKLEMKNIKAERVVFNTMDASVKKIMDLFLT